MKKLITSLTLTFLVSGIFGILFRDWLVFGLVTILQFLFFYFFNSIYENFLIKRAVELNALAEKAKYDNTVTVSCPCGSTQDVVLSLTEDTIYRCNDCKNEIRATTNIGTALVTTPLIAKS
jgi:hypothetical protein